MRVQQNLKNDKYQPTVYLPKKETVQKTYFNRTKIDRFELFQ